MVHSSPGTTVTSYHKCDGLKHHITFLLGSGEVQNPDVSKVVFFFFFAEGFGGGPLLHFFQLLGVL